MCFQIDKAAFKKKENDGCRISLRDEFPKGKVDFKKRHQCRPQALSLYEEIESSNHNKKKYIYTNTYKVVFKKVESCLERRFTVSCLLT